MDNPDDDSKEKPQFRSVDSCDTCAHNRKRDAYTQECTLFDYLWERNLGHNEWEYVICDDWRE